jgi:hypothetical protein
MKSSHLLTIVLTFATMGLAIPARADQAVTNDNVQNVVITGSNNTVNQQNNTSVRGNVRGGTNVGTSVRSRQSADVAGDNNTVNQSNQTQVDRHQHRNR